MLSELCHFEEETWSFFFIAFNNLHKFWQFKCRLISSIINFWNANVYIFPAAFLVDKGERFSHHMNMLDEK